MDLGSRDGLPSTATLPHQQRRGFGRWGGRWTPARRRGRSCSDQARQKDQEDDLPCLEGVELEVEHAVAVGDPGTSGCSTSGPRPPGASSIRTGAGPSTTGSSEGRKAPGTGPLGCETGRMSSDIEVGLASAAVGALAVVASTVTAVRSLALQRENTRLTLQAQAEAMQAQERMLRDRSMEESLRQRRAAVYASVVRWAYDLLAARARGRPRSRIHASTSPNARSCLMSGRKLRAASNLSLPSQGTR